METLQLVAVLSSERWDLNIETKNVITRVRIDMFVILHWCLKIVKQINAI
jgi:hypothetical protein